MIEPQIKKPSFFRTAVLNTVWLWRRVMSLKYNPLGKIPDLSLQT